MLGQLSCQFIEDVDPGYPDPTTGWYAVLLLPYLLLRLVEILSAGDDVVDRAEDRAAGLVVDLTTGQMGEGGCSCGIRSLDE